METDPSVVKDSRAERPWQAWIGFALLLLGVTGYFGVRQWYKTRIFEAVDTPVSLVQGHIRTGSFRLNLSATHYVSVDVGGSQWYYLPPPCDRDLLKTKWTLLRDGKVVQEEYRQSWWFDAEPGLYDLDLEVLADASCLNRYHPRLRVYTDRADYQFLSRTLELIAALLAATGASLFILALRFSRDAKTVTLGLSPNHNQNIQWAQRMPLRPPMSRMPGFGLIAVTIFGFLVFLFMILAPVTPRGLWVHLLKPGQLPAKSDAWTEPLTVRVTDNGVGRDPKLFVNSKQTAWDDLDRVLQQELAPRKDWVLYVTGDDAIPYQSVATVIDAARSRGAKVMLYHDPHEQPRESPPNKRPQWR
jgi:biopolymer transport protein ExbD